MGRSSRAWSILVGGRGKRPWVSQPQGTLAPGPLNHKGTHCLANDGHLLAVLGLPALPCLRALKSKLFIYTVTLGSGSHCYELICIEEVTEVSELGATVFQ